jgi:hypothetical protein
MLDFELIEMDRQGDWRAVLGAYRAAVSDARARNPESDGWIGRFPALEGVDPNQLARLHGRLIAGGLLRFELADRDAGLLYQLTPEGRRMLEGTPPETCEDSLET